MAFSNFLSCVSDLNILARKIDDTGQCFIGLSDLGEVPGKNKYDAAGPEVHIHQHEQTNNLKS